jgi:hypothetical protein
MLKFLLVLENFNTFVISTPFAEEWQLKQWLHGVKTVGATEFIRDPLANLPPRSFANQVLNEEEIEIGFIHEDDAISTDDSMLKDCHGTLMVDDNDSIFYSVKNRNANWELPYCIHAN